jgi:hypothetical protein
MQYDPSTVVKIYSFKVHDPGRLSKAVLGHSRMLIPFPRVGSTYSFLHGPILLMVQVNRVSAVLISSPLPYLPCDEGDLHHKEDMLAAPDKTYSSVPFVWSESGSRFDIDAGRCN